MSDLLNRTKQPCKDCMKDAGVSASEINEVLLVGGQTRMPRVSSLLFSNRLQFESWSENQVPVIVRRIGPSIGL